MGPASEAGAAARRAAAPPLGRKLLPHALLVGPALLFFAPALFFGRALYLRDTGLYFYPHKALIAQALRAGRLPQWNPFEYGGLPLLADPNFNVFHPLSWITWAVPLPLGFTLFVLGCALAAAYGARALARALGSSEEAALVAGLAFAWSGPFVSLIESGQCAAPAFLPAMCAAAVHLARAAPHRRLRPAALTAVAAALIFLSGTPEIGGVALVLALLLAAACAERASRAAALGWTSLAIALGAGLSAVQLAPAAAYLANSTRQAGFSAAAAAAYSLHPLRLPGIAIPYFAGELNAPGTPQWLLDPGSEMPYVQEIYAGSIALLLAGAGVRRAGRARLLVGAACAALLVLALGSHTPAFGWARALLPPIRIVRFPEKLVVPLALAVALLAASGWDRLRGWAGPAPGAPPPRLTPGAGRALTAFAWTLLALAAAALSLALRPGAFEAQLGEARAACLRATALPGAAGEALLAALALAFLLLRARGALRPGALRAGLLALLVLDLGSAAARTDYTVPAGELTSTPPLAARLAERGAGAAGAGRVSSEPTGLGVAQLDALFDPAWPRPRKLFALRRAALWDAGAALAGVRSDRGYSGFTPGALHRLYTEGRGRAALDLLDVRWGIEFGRGRPVYAALGFLPAFAALGGEVRVFRNPTPLPRVRLASAILAGPEADGLVPACGGAEAVWLSPGDAARLPPPLHAEPACPRGGSQPKGSAAFARDEAERVDVEVFAQAPALLVLADAWDPGWSARVDGAPAPSLAADGALRAVPVPAGRHRVEWSYRTPGLTVGAALTALSALLWAGLVLAGRPRAR